MQKTNVYSDKKPAEFNEYDYFIEGTNLTDLLEDRPGILVKKLFNMTSPLIECEITKEDVYKMIEYLKLDYSHDTTCLATRIKTNQKVSPQRLELIHRSEQLVKKIIRQDNIRVRFDNCTATITVDNPPEILDEKILVKLRDKLQEYGFKKVFLDITGYEKTKLEASVDENGYYYYQLPYTINLEKTHENIKCNAKLNRKLKLDNNLFYDEIIIQENGKISMPPTGDFKKTMNKIIASIERKDI